MNGSKKLFGNGTIVQVSSMTIKGISENCERGTEMITFLMLRTKLRLNSWLCQNVAISQLLHFCDLSKVCGSSAPPQEVHSSMKRRGEMGSSMRGRGGGEREERGRGGGEEERGKWGWIPLPYRASDIPLYRKWECRKTRFYDLSQDMTPLHQKLVPFSSS